MDLQSLYFWTQSIYAIIGIIVFVGIFVFLILVYKKLSRLEERVQRIAEKGERVAESARNIAESGEKLFFYGLYKIFKRAGRCRDDY